MGRTEEKFLAVFICISGGLIVARIAIWFCIIESASQNKRERQKQADNAAREKWTAEQYAVPAAFKGLKLTRPRSNPTLQKPPPTGKLVILFDVSGGKLFAGRAQEMILGSTIGLSPYHACLLPAHRADTQSEVSAVLWLSLNHKYDDSRILLTPGGIMSGVLLEEWLDIDAVVTDLEGNILVDTAHETLRFPNSAPGSKQTRGAALAEFESVTPRVVQVLREKLGMDIWQSTLPILDYDRHTLWVDPLKTFEDRQRALAR